MADIPSHTTLRRSNRQQIAPERFSELELNEPKRRKLLVGKASPGPVLDDIVSAQDSPSLPVELWLQIIKYVDHRDLRTLATLSRVSRGFYHTVNPILYRDVIASAPSHANIRVFIRTLERFLSIRQRKLLKAEKKYDGQQERFRKNLDEDFTPYCTQYVRRLFVGWSNPGRNHMTVLSRYIEEVLETLSGLEAVIWIDNHIPFTAKIGARISALNLKALTFNFSTSHDVSALRHIRDLKYFDAFSHQGRDKTDIIKDILWSSQNTLETFVYDEAITGQTNLTRLGELMRKDGQNLSLSKVTTLCLRPGRIEPLDTPTFLEAIDFGKLTYFEFSTTEHREKNGTFSHHALFKALLDKYGPGSGGQRLALRIFRFRSQVPIIPDETVLTLLASFDTLETFIFEETLYSPGDPAREIPSILIAALKRHKRMRWFGVNVPSHSSGGRWQFSKEQLVQLREMFPELRVLSCLCSSTEKDDFFGVLPTFPKLQYYHLPMARWVSWNTAAQQQEMVESILHPFLRQLQTGKSGVEPQIWEDRFKLSMLVLGNAAYEVASGFPKTRGKAPTINQLKTEDGTVSYRSVAIQKVFDGMYADLNFIKPVEWRVRNSDGTRGDWFQGIKF
ncbi:hypothetical protein ABW19_dt0206371 [Dactylella cylindrospora]|nr:hypothetical protein ABW19_dt0206371 [Dactylella cylindrospora]